MACTSGGKSVVPVQFPAGLRVLLVDDDVVCLRVLEQKLRKCMYSVTSCSQATVALELLRERKGCFDIVLSDVHMPDMDGFKLLELVGLEMDLPVIMISADGRTNLVMRGIRHGACDYLIKPIRDEELKNIWQHVVRKRWNESKEPDHSDSIEDSDRQKRATDDAEYASSVNEGGDGIPKTQKKRRDTKDEDDTELEIDDPTTAKKPRVVWSVDLHQQFVSAVNQLGIDKAVPKRILELMNVPGLTRENVASHLQKFRLYLKRLSGVAQQQGGLPSSYCGSVEQNPNLASIGRFDIQALAASGQLPPQTLAALHVELLSQPGGNLVLPAMDQPALLHASLQGSKCIPVDQNVAYVMLEPSRSINVQPSCLVVSSQSSTNFQSGNSPASVNQNCSFRNTAMDYSNSSFQSNNQPGVGQILDVECKPACMLSEFAAAGSVSSVSSCSKTAEANTCQQIQNPTSTFNAVRQLPGAVTNLNSVQGSYSGKSDPEFDQGPTRNPVYIGKGTSIPSRFAVDEHEFPLSNVNCAKFYAENNGNKVKQEPNMDFAENVKVGIPVRQHFSQMI